MATQELLDRNDVHLTTLDEEYQYEEFLRDQQLVERFETMQDLIKQSDVSSFLMN